MRLLKIYFFVVAILLWGFSAFGNRNNIPDVLVPFASDGSTTYAIVVEKETQQLFIYAYDNAGTFIEIERFACSTGEVPGPKFQSGDRKTPEGVYFFIRKYNEKELSPIYGTGAFPTDYPNMLDIMEGKTGNAIWLHGTNKPLKPRDSNGCIVLKNEDLNKVAEYITLNRTPIIITKKLSYATSDYNTLISIINTLMNWNNTLANGTSQEYLKYYEKMPDISWWQEWKAARTSASLSLGLKNISIFRHNEIYTVIADQFLKIPEIQDGQITSFKYHPVETQKFYFRYNGHSAIIIGSEFQGVKEGNPFISAFRNIVPTSIETVSHEIIKTLDAWIAAWSSKNIDLYSSFYARDFYSMGMNKKKWIRKKKHLNRSYTYIRISTEEPVIQKKKDEIYTVSFIQTYKSSGYNAKGLKELELKQENGKWKIYRESWREI